MNGVVVGGEGWKLSRSKELILVARASSHRLFWVGKMVLVRFGKSPYFAKIKPPPEK